MQREFPRHLSSLAGLYEFSEEIMVKHEAPQLLRRWLARDQWECEPIMFSGVTDCYQPAEREFRLTRGCLEVAAEARQPVMIVTKNALVTRDIDLLADIMRPSLREQDFETEKKVIIEEIYKYEDQPPFGAHEKCMSHYTLQMQLYMD